MADFIICNYPTVRVERGIVSIAITQPRYRIKISAKTVSEALETFRQHVETDIAKGEPATVCITLARGSRAPRGWRKLTDDQTSQTICL